MPLPREGKVLDFSRWQQSLIGVLQPDISYNEDVMMNSRAVVTIDARLAYRNKGDKDDDWKHLASSLEQRELNCAAENVSSISSLLRFFQCSNLNNSDR